MATTTSRPAREQIVLAAARLIRARGYTAASLRDIVEEAEAPWGSLHYYFPGGKEQIVAEAVALGDAQVAAFIEESFQRTRTADGALRSFFQRSADIAEETDFQFGCPIATVALERAADRDEVATACETAFTHWLETFVAGVRGHGIPARRARKLATVILSQYEGALMLSRVMRSGEPLRTTGAGVRSLVADGG